MSSEAAEKISRILQSTVVSICQKVVDYNEELVVKGVVSVEADGDDLCTVSFTESTEDSKLEKSLELSQGEKLDISDKINSTIESIESSNMKESSTDDSGVLDLSVASSCKSIKQSMLPQKKRKIECLDDSDVMPETVITIAPKKLCTEERKAVSRSATPLENRTNTPSADAQNATLNSLVTQAMKVWYNEGEEGQRRLAEQPQNMSLKENAHPPKYPECIPPPMMPGYPMYPFIPQPGMPPTAKSPFYPLPPFSQASSQFTSSFSPSLPQQIDDRSTPTGPTSAGHPYMKLKSLLSQKYANSLEEGQRLSPNTSLTEESQRLVIDEGMKVKEELNTSSDMTVVETPNGEKLFRCNICFKAFTFSTNLTRHQRNLHGKPHRRRTKEMIKRERESASSDGNDSGAEMARRRSVSGDSHNTLNSSFDSTGTHTPSCDTPRSLSEPKLHQMQMVHGSGELPWPASVKREASPSPRMSAGPEAMVYREVPRTDPRLPPGFPPHLAQFYPGDPRLPPNPLLFHHLSQMQLPPGMAEQPSPSSLDHLKNMAAGRPLSFLPPHLMPMGAVMPPVGAAGSTTTSRYDSTAADVPPPRPPSSTIKPSPTPPPAAPSPSPSPALRDPSPITAHHNLPISQPQLLTQQPISTITSKDKTPSTKELLKNKIQNRCREASVITSTGAVDDSSVAALPKETEFQIILQPELPKEDMAAELLREVEKATDSDARKSVKQEAVDDRVTPKTPSGVRVETNNNIPADNPVYKCGVCAHSFTGTDVYKEHLKEHAMTNSEGKRPAVEKANKPTDGYICKHCGMTFQSHGSYKRHVKTTHGKGQNKRKDDQFLTMFPCEICGQSFYNPSNLHRHLVNSHGTTEVKGHLVVGQENQPRVFPEEPREADTAENHNLIIHTPERRRNADLDAARQQPFPHVREALTGRSTPPCENTDPMSENRPPLQQPYSPKLNRSPFHPNSPKLDRSVDKLNVLKPNSPRRDRFSNSPKPERPRDRLGILKPNSPKRDPPREKYIPFNLNEFIAKRVIQEVTSDSYQESTLGKNAVRSLNLSFDESPNEKRDSSCNGGSDSNGLFPSHATEEHFVCGICGATFTFQTNLTRHQRKIHGKPYVRKSLVSSSPLTPKSPVVSPQTTPVPSPKC